MQLFLLVLKQERTELFLVTRVYCSCGKHIDWNLMMFTKADCKTVCAHCMHCSLDILCVLQVCYSFSFWLMFRQQLKERQEEQSLKEKSLDEVKVMPRNSLSNCFYEDYSSCVCVNNILILFCPVFQIFPSPRPSFLGFLHISGGKSAIASGSDADLRSERVAGEILDPLLLFHVLCYQLLWKGIDRI